MSRPGRFTRGISETNVFSDSDQGQAALEEDAEAAAPAGSDCSVRVLARVRPPNENERARGDRSVVFQSRNDASHTFDVAVPAAGGRDVTKSFTFDHCFSEVTTQLDFFTASGIVALLDSALDGYAATVFAYGQTGSGKTYSMSGLEERIGSSFLFDSATAVLPTRRAAPQQVKRSTLTWRGTTLTG